MAEKKKRAKGAGAKPAIKVGDAFTLKCGIVVEVVEYFDCNNIVVKDIDGNSLRTSSKSLKEGTTRWYTNGVKVSCAKPKKERGLAKKYVVGKIIETRDYGKVEIVSIQEIPKQRITLKFINTGNLQTVSGGRHFRPYSIIDKILNKSFGRKPNPNKGKSTERQFPIGSNYISKRHGVYTILSIENNTCIKIIWQDTGTIDNVSAAKLRANSCKDSSLIKNYLNARGYFIYCAKLGEDVVYIGRGNKDRYKHVNSGASCSRELNRLYFNGDKVLPEIMIDDLSYTESVYLERYFLDLYKPFCNKMLPATGTFGVIDDLREFCPNIIVSEINQSVFE